MHFGGEGACLETVRALHQTVVALRAALEQSRSEILELKTKTFQTEDPEIVGGKDLEQEPIKSSPTQPKKQISQQKLDLSKKSVSKDRKEETQQEPRQDPPIDDVLKTQTKNCGKFKATISIKAEGRTSTSLESLLVLKSPICKKFTVSKTVSFSNLAMNDGNDEEQQNDLDQDQDQDQEVDDIELIFTTDDTNDSDFKEQLVSIDAGDTIPEVGHLQRPDLDQTLDVSDRELDDDVFNDGPDVDFRRENSQLYDSKSDNSINQEKSLKSCYSYQDSSFENRSLEKDESFDRFEERVRIVETDISKCGIQEVEYGGLRRNTCPNPLQYRPLLHREALGKGARRTRPILVHSNATRRDSGAQTDISALPGSSWVSESNLANKIKGDNFTTLPSKFPMPGSRLKLSEKTVEARRVLLSDIGFTSMVPELSRSADYLCSPNVKPPVVTTYGQFLRTSDYSSPGFTSQRFTWTTTAATPSDSSYSHSRYNSFYPLASPPISSRRCSAPVSPSRRTMQKPPPSRVRFANGSLPELRGDWTLTMDSGDSTDSLVEEAENYLRRSIDCITSRDYSCERKKTVPRRASAPEPSGDNVPPQGWQPFLPRVPRDLRPDHWVKVITPEGRVRGGRVRYVGPVVSQSDQFVGVQLATPDGHSDGTFSGRRYFQCEPYHGIFVPFKKVIMGWRP